LPWLPFVVSGPPPEHLHFELEVGWARRRRFGNLERYYVRIHQVDEVLVERLHLVLLPAILDEVADLADARFENQIPNGGGSRPSPSAATTRPFPSLRGSSRCEMTAFSASAMRMRTTSCSSGGNIAMIRMIVVTASGVCSVESRRWPGLGRLERRVDRLRIAHLANQHDIRDPDEAPP
jgi:hypothetical protein